MSTSSPQSLERIASGLLHIAQQRLLRAYPFHAHFVATWDVHASDVVRTIGVTVRGNAIVLLFNPAFVRSCTLEELGGVLLHEVHHLLFDHLFLDPAHYPDHQALVIAEEVTANEWIREPLPGEPLLLAQFPQLPPDEDTQTRYRRLAEESTGGEMSSSSEQKQPLTGRKPGPHVPNSAPLQPLDDHDIWRHALSAGVVGQMAVHVQIREVAKDLPVEAWQQLPAAIQHRLRTLCHGDTSGSSHEGVSHTGKGRLDWHRLLRRYVRDATEPQPVFTRPPRRFPALVGIIPGHLHRPIRPTVMVVIDTSASLSPDMLAMIAAELDHLARSHTVMVVECDAVVHAVYRYRGRLDKVHGRGGTDLRPPFAPAILRRVHPDVVVYFTDGYGPAPQVAPAMPVIWCLTPGSVTPVSWGRVVQLPLAARSGGVLVRRTTMPAPVWRRVSSGFQAHTAPVLLVQALRHGHLASQGFLPEFVVGRQGVSSEVKTLHLQQRHGDRPGRSSGMTCSTGADDVPDTVQCLLPPACLMREGGWPGSICTDEFAGDC